MVEPVIKNGSGGRGRPMDEVRTSREMIAINGRNDGTIGDGFQSGIDGLEMGLLLRGKGGGKIKSSKEDFRIGKGRVGLGDESFKGRDAGRSGVLVAVVDTNRKDNVFGLRVRMGVFGDQRVDVVEVGTTKTVAVAVRGYRLKTGEVAVTNKNIGGGQRG